MKEKVIYWQHENDFSVDKFYLIMVIWWWLFQTLILPTKTYQGLKRKFFSDLVLEPFLRVFRGSINVFKLKLVFRKKNQIYIFNNYDDDQILKNQTIHYLFIYLKKFDKWPGLDARAWDRRSTHMCFVSKAQAR
jgi:hypothetical protein